MDVVACVLNMSFTGVAELVAVVMTHPTVIVDVAAGLLTVMGPTSDKAPALVVVALPFTMKLPAMDTDPVVEAFPNEARPVALNVPSVWMFVLMVVAACAMPALTKMTPRPRRTVRAVLPRPFTYFLMLFIIIDEYFQANNKWGANASCG
jgi:hypothetical protein